MVEAGEFRRDLYYRINVFPIYVPSLGERQDDLLLLTTALLKRLSERKDYHLTDSAFQQLKQHDFPGNIRELSNTLNRATILTDTNLIERSTIEECLMIDHELNQQTNVHSLQSKEVEKGRAWVDLKAAESRYLSDLMAFYNKDKEKVAEAAGISLRSLYRKMQD